MVHRPLRKNYNLWLFVCLLPVVLLLLSALLVAKSGWLQSALLSAHSEHPVEAKGEYMALVSDSYQPSARFTANEAAHMRDVDALFRTLEFLLLGLMVVLAGLGYLVRSELRRALVWGGGILFILLFISSVVSFDPLFDVFHRVFFPQGNFAFPPGSLLIAYYPESYFAANAFWMGVVAFVLSLASITAGWMIGRRHRAQS